MATALFVHAHPDDESIAAGGTIAALAAAGHRVVVLTATRGEAGEVIGPLRDRLEGDRAALAAHREQEIAAAMRALDPHGRVEQRFLGEGAPGGALSGLEPRRFEDSGMVWGADGLAHPDPHRPAEALCAAPEDLPAQYIAEVILALRPDAVVTDNSGGGYGHPDHRRVHQETLQAVRLADERGWRTPAVYLIDPPREASRDRFDPRRSGFAETGFRPAESIPAVDPDGPPEVVVDISAHRQAKAAALAAHATQVQVRGEFFALSNGVGQHLTDREYYSAWRRPAQREPGTLLPAEGATARPARPSRWAMPVGVLLGLIAGVMGSMHHLHAYNLGAILPALDGTLLPWGVLLSGLLAVASQVAVGTWGRSIGAIVLCGLSTSAVSFLLSMPGLAPGGDLVITSFARSLAWLYLPLISAILLAFFLPRLWLPRPGRDRSSQPAVASGDRRDAGR